MATFSYIARNPVGLVSRGELDARSLVELRSTLNAMDLRLLSFQVKRPWLGAMLWQRLHPNWWYPARTRDLELVLHQLAIMLRSGLRLLDALKALQMQTEQQSMVRVLEQIHTQVQRGSTLSAAFAEHKIVPAVVVRLIGIGEQTGSLDRVLVQSRDYIQQRRTMVNDVRMALAYPAAVLLASLSIAVYLVLVVIPQLEAFLATIGRELPTMTQSLVDLAHVLQTVGPSLIVLSTLAAAGLCIASYVRSTRLWLDRCLLRVPLLGRLLQLAGTTALANSLAVMLENGVRLVDAVRIAGQIQGNQHLARLLKSAATTIARGQPLAPSLAARNGFSPILVSMVEVAEQAGNLESTIQEVSTFCNSELKLRLKRLTQMVEPTVIVLAGLVVGYVYIAFFVALMSVGGSLR